MAHLLALGFLGLFPNFVFSWAFTDFIGLPPPKYFILILGVYRPAIPYSLCLHYFEPAVAFSYFFLHHTLPMGLLFAISLFPDSFEPICFLKAHLFISWNCDPLFLPLRLNGFCSLSFANFFSVCVARLGFLPFIRVPQKRPSTGLNEESVKDFQLYATILCDHLWMARNKARVEGSKSNPTNLSRQIFSVFMEHKEAWKEQNERSSKDVVWSPPPRSWINLNFDAIICEEKTTVAVVGRDTTSNLLLA